MAFPLCGLPTRGHTSCALTAKSSNLTWSGISPTSRLAALTANPRAQGEGLHALPYVPINWASPTNVYDLWGVVSLGMQASPANKPPVVSVMMQAGWRTHQRPMPHGVPLGVQIVECRANHLLIAPSLRVTLIWRGAVMTTQKLSHRHWLLTRSTHCGWMQHR